jgi:hypothetical protein
MDPRTSKQLKTLAAAYKAGALTLSDFIKMSEELTGEEKDGADEDSLPDGERASACCQR